MEYDRIILELMNRVQILEEKVQRLEAGQASQVSQAKPAAVSEVKDSKKYRPLSEAILAKSGSKVVFSFSEIEDVLGFMLPASARNHRAFWANTKTHSIASSWMSVGYETMDVDIENEKVTFIAMRSLGDLSKEQEIMAFLHERVFDPILSSPDAPIGLKRGVNLTIGRMNRLPAAKMIQYYWSAISSEHSARFGDGVHQEGFTRFEDVKDEFAARFNDEWLKG